MTQNGFNLATGLASPASLVNRITSSTSLYASGASSERTFGVLAYTEIPLAANSFLSASPSIDFLACVLDINLPAPWHEDENASFEPDLGPARTYEAVPMSPGTNTG